MIGYGPLNRQEYNGSSGEEKDVTAWLATFGVCYRLAPCSRLQDYRYIYLITGYYVSFEFE